MRIEEIRSFVTVCQMGSLTIAAAKLGVSQPALSRTIRGLEGKLRVTLFRRTGRGVATTDAGEIVLKHSQRILAGLADLETDLDALYRNGGRGEVRVLLPLNVGRLLEPFIIQKLAATHPGVSLRVLERANDEITERLLSGDADCALFYETPNHGPVLRDVVAEEVFLVIGLPKLIGRKTVPMSWSEVAALPLILPSRQRPIRKFIEQHAAAQGIRLNVVQERETGHGMLSCVINGEGASIMTYAYIMGDLLKSRLSMRPVGAPPLSRRIAIAVRDKSLSNSARATAAALREVAIEQSPMLHWSRPGQLDEMRRRSAP